MLRSCASCSHRRLSIDTVLSDSDLPGSLSLVERGHGAGLGCSCSMPEGAMPPEDERVSWRDSRGGSLASHWISSSTSPGRPGSPTSSMRRPSWWESTSVSSSPVDTRPMRPHSHIACGLTPVRSLNHWQRSWPRRTGSPARSSSLQSLIGTARSQAGSASNPSGSINLNSGRSDVEVGPRRILALWASPWTRTAERESTAASRLRANERA